jgi:hypothetical protein
MSDSEPRRDIRARPRFFAGEVIQTSAMDCGPATLKAVAAGFGIAVSYGRLREACHTDVDGTSIDTVEALALDLGLRAEQVMLPLDQVLAPEGAALPAIAVVTDPTGGAHFVVAWNRVGPFVQVMDPARGRLWLRTRTFLDSLYMHAATVPAATWRQWLDRTSSPPLSDVVSQPFASHGPRAKSWSRSLPPTRPGVDSRRSMRPQGWCHPSCGWEPSVLDRLHAYSRR